MATTTNRNLMTRNAVDAGAWPRWVNLVLGAWLFISAFIWPHTASSQANTWIVGALMAGAAIWAMFAPPVRWVNTVLAIWLFISTFFIPHVTTGTVWNNAIVAILVFLVSLVPSGVSRTSSGTTTTTTTTVPPGRTVATL